MDLLLSSKFSKIHKDRFFFNVNSKISSDLVNVFVKMKQERSLIFL